MNDFTVGVSGISTVNPLSSASSTFVTNFVIAGMEPTAGLELEEATRSESQCSMPRERFGSREDFLASDLDDFNPLQRSYKPKILKFYPQQNAWTNMNEDGLSRLLLPHGLRFCTQREISDCQPKTHSFVLTKEDGQKSYGVAIIFYEEVKDSNICHALHTLQKMYTTESEVGSHASGAPSGGGGGTLKRSDRLMRPRSAATAKINSERSRSLPRHYQQARLSASTLDLSSATYDYRKDTLYTTKAIAFVLAEPLVEIAGQILKAMQKYVCKHDFDVQVLEGLVYNLLYDIPIPSAGRSVRFWCLGEAVMLSMPKIPTELPLFDYNLLDFFDILGVENAIKFLVCIMLENQILVYSKEFDKLMLVCECASALLYPFRWQHVYVPILPPNLENFLDAPVPYIMGLVRRTHDIELSKKGSVCIVDIDSGELDLPEELPEFPYEAEFAEEIRNSILNFGGQEGANVLKEHAIETRDILESTSMSGSTTIDQNNGSSAAILDNSDTMEQLNKMISKFEQMSERGRKKSLNSSSSTSSKASSSLLPGGTLMNTIVSQTCDRLRLNNAIREIFVNRFAHMFLSYEHFVIVPNMEDPESLTPQQKNSENVLNFDKTSFLSDQKHSFLPFLSSFLETQMFSTFIDECIMAMSEDVPVESPFEVRLKTLKERFGESLVRTPTYEPCDMIPKTDEVLGGRLKKVELTVTPQKSSQVKSRSAQSSKFRARNENNSTDSAAPAPAESSPQRSIPGIFPLLDSSRLEGRRKGDSSAIFVRGDRKSKILDLQSVPSPKISLLNPSPAAIAETNWKFVSELLKECKNKTKRILVEKLGKEAVEWGHGEQFSGSEENMLVASVCDLIERIWSHGLQNRTGKSSLWHFLYKFGRANERKFKGTLGNFAYCVPLVRSKPFLLPGHARPVQVVSDPLKKTSTFDSTVMSVVHNVSTIHEIKTEIGYARAWVRLALERKVLAQYLHVLVSDPVFLKNLYKRYAFLRCEDEREQALYYLQTLNTVEFSCFTNAYTKSSLLYQVLIFPSTKSGHTPCSANVWIHVVGSNGETDIIEIPRGVIHFSFWAKNLGVITSLRIGHDNSGSNPNWLVEHVLVKNEFTGQAFKFACGRWLGQSIDDGSRERYMVGYPVSGEQNVSSVVQLCAYPPQNTCPATSIKSVDPENETIELQTMLGDAINRIIKFYHKSLNEKISYAHLMCGQSGLVHALINIFSFGYKSARLFGRNLSVWDFFLKVTMDFNQSLQAFLGAGGVINSAQNSPQSSPRHTAHSPRIMSGSQTLDGVQRKRNSSLSNLLDSPKRSLNPRSEAPSGGSGANTPVSTLSRSAQFRRMYTKLITRIETTCHRLGKDDKFQLFVCLASHDRLLGRIVTDMTKVVATQQLYEEYSFMRRPHLTSFLSHILEAMNDISVPVDPAMKKTLEQHNYLK